MAKMPISREALAEAQKNAMNKAMYGATLKLHCLECIGETPKEKICAGCALFKISTQSKRQKFTKTAIRKIIREFCIECVGTITDICQSPGCALFPFRMNQKLTKTEWKASVVTYRMRRRASGKNQSKTDKLDEKN